MFAFINEERKMGGGGGGGVNELLHIFHGIKRGT